MKNMTKYTLADVSRITEVPKSTIQKYYVLENDSVSNSKRPPKRVFSYNDLKDIFFIKINLAIGKKHSYIKECLKYDSKKKNELFKKAIATLKKTIQISSSFYEEDYCRFIDIGGLASTNEVIRKLNSNCIDYFMSKDFNNTMQCFQLDNKTNNKIDGIINELCLIECEEKNLYKNKERKQKINSLLNNLKSILKSAYKDDFIVSMFYKFLLSFFEKEFSKNVYERYEFLFKNEISIVDEFFKKISSSFTEIVTTLFDESSDLGKVLECFEKLRLEIMKHFSKKDSYFIVNGIVDSFCSTEISNSCIKKALKKIKQANEIFQKNYQFLQKM